MAKKESPLHIGIEYNQAVASKKNILFSETAMLNVVKHIRTYSVLRKKEFILKGKAQRALTSVKTAITSIEKELPRSEGLEKEKSKSEKRELHISEQEAKLIEKAKSQKQKKEIQEDMQELKRNRDLEEELADIQKKLAQLG